MSHRTLSDTLNVTLVDSDDLTQITGHEREKVALVLGQLVEIGFRIVEEPHVKGSTWTASCRRPYVPTNEVQVEKLGHRFFIRGRVLEYVHKKVADLVEQGMLREGEIFRIGPYYTAVLREPSDSAPSSS